VVLFDVGKVLVRVEFEIGHARSFVVQIYIRDRAGVKAEWVANPRSWRCPLVVAQNGWLQPPRRAPDSLFVLRRSTLLAKL
jgi:hypothetical protein